MKWQKYFLIAFSIFTAVVVAYLTYIYKTTGVPFYRHNETYRIIHSDTISTQKNTERNYTEPFKKYSLIDDEDELNFPHSDSIVLPFDNDDNTSVPGAVNELPLKPR